MFLFFVVIFTGRTQNIQLKVVDQPLSKVLYDLGSAHNIQFSYSNNLLSKCLVTDTASYLSIDDALNSLLLHCDYRYHVINDVFIIYNGEIRKRSKQKPLYIYKGQIIDGSTLEPLPFANIQINESGVHTDVNGNYAFKSNDSIEKISISHIGYYLLDTLLNANTPIFIKLSSSVLGLDEIVVKPQTKFKITDIGKQSGFIKLNHQVANFLPGNGGNTVFNLLRLQPGILAAGEPSHEYSIWGSYQGQTQIVFDGMTIFNMNSNKYNIGVVNPFIVKDVEIYKGGYGVEIGDRVGGVVQITGKSGNPYETKVKLQLDNQMANLSVNIPIKKKIALQLMYRQTYLNKTNWNEVLRLPSKQSENVYSSNYKFKDLNFKFSGKASNGDHYYVSAFMSDDYANSHFESNSMLKNFSDTISKGQMQLGGALFYGKNWEKSGTTNMSLSFSNMNAETRNSGRFNTNPRNLQVNNYISEMSLKVNHLFPVIKKHQLNIGANIFHNKSALHAIKFDVSHKSTINEAHRLQFFVKDKYFISNKISIQPGIRIDKPINIRSIYIQPRISAQIKPINHFNLNFSWGLYHQFITENVFTDPKGNFLYHHWSIANDQSIKVVKGVNYIAGWSYQKGSFVLSMEGFYKENENLTRFITHEKNWITFVSNGESRTYGCDIYIKKKIKNHDFWLAYTWSKSEELFSYFKESTFRLSPLDQRHEIKGVAILKFNPVFVSLNYVYGSGTANSSQISSTNEVIPYKRLDMAFLYRFDYKKANLETGISVMNVLNNDNVQYNHITNLANGKTIYSQAIPLTLMIFIKMWI
jgi:hypothetical protein